MAPKRRRNQRRPRRSGRRPRASRGSRRRVPRVRDRAQVFLADHLFALPTYHPRAGEFVYLGIARWWLLLVECVGLICAWIIAKDSEALKDVLDQKTKPPGSSSSIPRWIVDKRTESNGGVIVSSAVAVPVSPVAVSTAAVVSIDNLINQSQIVEERLTAIPADSPWPFTEYEHYQRYFTTRFLQYRIKKVTFILRPSEAVQNLEGRWTMAFTPMASTQDFTKCFNPMGDAQNAVIIPLPTETEMLNSPYVTSATEGKSLRLDYVPSGYWADWQQLGYDLQMRSDQSLSDAISKTKWDWKIAGFGSRPFGILNIARYDSLRPDTLMMAVDGRYNTARLKTISIVELRGMEVPSWQSFIDMDNACSRRVMRGYWVTSMPGGYDKTRFFPPRGSRPPLMFRFNSERAGKPIREDYEIVSPQSQEDE